jgi:hypothetical protein
MVEMKKKKDESKKEEIIIKEKAAKRARPGMARPLPGIITTTELGPLKGTSDKNPKTRKQKGKDSN